MTIILTQDPLDVQAEAWACLDRFLLGKSPAIMAVKQTIFKVAKTDVTILLRGESGTGKGLAAQAIYQTSLRNKKPFVKVLCAAIPEGLLESEFFGFERGSFTGAHRKNTGKFEFAHQGTIFLDEIGDIPQSLQAKLLQVLQDGEFARIGGRDMKVDARVIAATNRSLEKAVSDGLFREDLFYRLNVVGIVLPPLRERRDDIPHLANHFVEKYSEQYNRSFKKLSDKIHGKILDHEWPGNVRQLENVIKRMIVLDSDKIDIPASDLSIEKSQRSPTALSVSVVEVNSTQPVVQIAQNRDNLKDVVRHLTYQAEEEAIRRVLLENRWNRKNSARVLGVSYKTLLQKMKQYNLSGQKG